MKQINHEGTGMTFKPVMLHVYLMASFGAETKAISFLFKDAEAAKQVHDQLFEAAKAYHARTNERERVVTFETAHGPSSVDVSNISALGTEDPMGIGAEHTRAWNLNMALIRSEMDAAYEAAKGITP